MAGILNSRDFYLSSIGFLSPTGFIDLKYLMNEISYHEDLFNNTISGYVMITESNAYAELLSLTGNEFIRLVFSKAGDPTFASITKKFRAYKIDKRKLEGNMYTESYLIRFCSEELLLSEQYKISKSYVNQTIDYMIRDICTMNPGLNIGTHRYTPSNIQQTYGNYNFIIPNLKPLDAINWLSVYARPTPDVGVGSDMLFYENKSGFFFNSIQGLAANTTIYSTYRYDPKNLFGPGESNFSLDEEVFNALTYEVLDTYDALEATSTGMFANQLISVDILTRTKMTTNFDYLDYWNNKVPSSSKLNKFPVTNNFTNRNGDTVNETSQAMLKLVYSNFADANNSIVQSTPGSVAPNIFAETFIPNRTAQLALANYTRLKLSVPGDPNLTVGSKIVFELLSKNPTQKQTDAFLSGAYLVTAVRHLINQNDYKTIFEIAKDSVPNQYLNVPSGSSTWNDIVK
jgi:hypothetical protein